MARAVLERLPLEGDETVLDAGCGSGRVTELLLERLPHGHVVAVDSAPVDGRARARGARRRSARRVLCQSLTELTLDEPVDAAFSNAVFHWIADHERLFERLHAALRPGARLVAQCGGKGNIDAFRRLADEVAAEPPYAEHMRDFAGPWNYASAEETEARLRCGRLRRGALLAPALAGGAAGPARVRAHGLPRQPSPGAARGAAPALRRGGGAPLGRAAELEYVRLNIDARRA